MSEIRVKKIRDALTGKVLEVCISEVGKLFLVEGFNQEFITSVTPSKEQVILYNCHSLSSTSKSKCRDLPK